MAITVEAVYENGTLKLEQPLPLQEQAKVRISIHVPGDVQAALAAVERGYGLLRWTGDRETLERIALDEEFGILESP